MKVNLAELPKLIDDAEHDFVWALQHGTNEETYEAQRYLHDLRELRRTQEQAAKVTSLCAMAC